MRVMELTPHEPDHGPGASAPNAAAIDRQGWYGMAMNRKFVSSNARISDPGRDRAANAAARASGSRVMVRQGAFAFFHALEQRVSPIALVPLVRHLQLLLVVGSALRSGAFRQFARDLRQALLELGFDRLGLARVLLDPIDRLARRLFGIGRRCSASILIWTSGWLRCSKRLFDEAANSLATRR
jgi:hypothetical protein